MGFAHRFGSTSEPKLSKFWKFKFLIIWKLVSAFFNYRIWIIYIYIYICFFIFLPDCSFNFRISHIFKNSRFFKNKNTQHRRVLRPPPLRHAEGAASNCSVSFLVLHGAIWFDTLIIYNGCVSLGSKVGGFQFWAWCIVCLWGSSIFCALVFIRFPSRRYLLRTIYMLWIYAVCTLFVSCVRLRYCVALVGRQPFFCDVAWCDALCASANLHTRRSLDSGGLSQICEIRHHFWKCE